MSDCVHQLDLCPECGGLQVTQYTELNGISGIAFSDDTGKTRFRGEGARLFWTPGPTPCETPLRDTES